MTTVAAAVMYLVSERPVLGASPSGSGVAVPAGCHTETVRIATADRMSSRLRDCPGGSVPDAGASTTCADGGGWQLRHRVGPAPRDAVPRFTMPEAGARGAAATPWEIDGRQGRAEPALGSRATRRNSDGSSTQASPSARTHAAVPTADGSQGVLHLEDDDHDGPQGPRSDVHLHDDRLLPRRRPDGVADPCRTRGPGYAVPVQRAVQPAVHHARHDHAVVLRDADRVRFRERDPAAADRRPGRCIPPPERLQLLAVPVRCHPRDRRLHHPGRCRRLRLDGVFAAHRRHPLARRRREPLGHGPRRVRPRHDSRWRQHDDDGDRACVAPA